MSDKARKTLVFVSAEIWRYVIFVICFVCLAFLFIFASLLFFMFTRSSLMNAEQLIQAAVVILAIIQIVYIFYLIRRIVIFFRHR